MSNRTCTIDNCARPHLAKGLCSLHYDRMRKGTDMNAPVEERFSTPAEAFEARTMPVTESSCVLWIGATTKQGYGKISVGGTLKLVHRYSWEQACGSIPEGMFVDHMCHTPACVNPDHLRLATNQQNLQNRRGACKGSKSGIRGVAWSTKEQKWIVQVQAKGKNHRGGAFTDKHEAGRVAAEMRARLMDYSLN